MFQGWTEHPEVVAGHWPATLEQAFGIPVAYEYPLSEADAEALADYFIDVYAPVAECPQRTPAVRGVHHRRAGVPHGVRLGHR